MLFAASAFGRLPLESAINTRVCYNLSLVFGLPKQLLRLVFNLKDFDERFLGKIKNDA